MKIRRNTSSTPIRLLFLALGSGLCMAAIAQPGADTFTTIVPADLALHGPLYIGDTAIEWGSVVQLRRTDAKVYENGRCTFSYRYRVANLGKGAAGNHVNRLRLGEAPVLAENTLDALAANQTRVQTGTFTLWSGENVVYVELDAGKQVVDSDRSNNLRRVRIDLAPGCADPRPKARPPGSTRTKGIDPPPAKKMEPTSTGTRAAPPGTRAPAPQGKPAQQGKPAPSGPTSKPVPPSASNCKPMLSVTRTVGVTRAGAMSTAIKGWEAAAWSQYGGGYRWDKALDQNTECKVQAGWTCTAKARPCK